MKLRIVTILAALLFVPSIPALADDIYPIVFPVDGENHFSDNYGDPRDSGTRSHEGVDIMAEKLVSVVAAADGTVGWMHNERGANCCDMELIHDDGYRSWYIHLNNDTPGTDDGQGWGFAPGIEPGVRVRAGQLIGYVGDSGNAENSGSHLHFELHDEANTPFNPYESLIAATPADSSVVSWHIGTLGDGRLEVTHDPIDLHVNEDTGLAAVGDFDGDGVDEVAVGGGHSPGWKVAELSGELATWSPADSAGASKVLVGDFDGDADDDIALFYSSLQWRGLRSEGSHLQEETWGHFGGQGWSEFLVGDFDGDGSEEILSFHPGTGRWWSSRLQGEGLAHSVYTSYGTAHGWQTHLIADVDGDGDDDLLSFHPSNGTWWMSSEGSSPRLLFDASTNSGWQHLAAVDKDGDGADELAMFHPSNGTWWVVDYSQGGGQAHLWAQFSTKTGWVNPVAADFNSDGSEDLLIRHSPTGRVWTVLGGETGRLSYLGTFVGGVMDAEWLIRGESSPGLLTLDRD